MKRLAVIVIGAILIALFHYGSYLLNPITRLIDWRYQILFFVEMDVFSACIFIAAFPARIAIGQTIILLIACFNNILLYWDLVTGSHMVYDNWENNVKLLTYIQFILLFIGRGNFNDSGRHSKRGSTNGHTVANLETIYADSSVDSNLQADKK